MPETGALLRAGAGGAAAAATYGAANYFAHSLLIQSSSPPTFMLKQIGLGLRLYQDREGQFPPDLESLFKSLDVPDLRLFLCPCCKEKAGKDFKTHYVYLPCQTDAPNPSLWILAYDDVPCHGPGAKGRIVLFQDGSARYLEEDNFQEQLKAQLAPKK